jgi:hypothetical protein
MRKFLACGYVWSVYFLREIRMGTNEAAQSEAGYICNVFFGCGVFSSIKDASTAAGRTCHSSPTTSSRRTPVGSKWSSCRGPWQDYRVLPLII